MGTTDETARPVVVGARIRGLVRRAVSLPGRLLADWRLRRALLGPDDIKATQVLPGWCPLEKAEYLAGLVHDTRAKCIVEIGVFGGRSLVPMALAARGHGGVVWGIDPWTARASVEGTNDVANAEWWSALDYEAIYGSFVAALEQFRVNGNTRVLRMTDEEALPRFAVGQIDLLHVDGNHSPEVSMRYVRQWGPKLAPRGHLVMDDIDWPTQRDTVAALRRGYETVREEKSWAVYRVRQTA
jgi:predicted O-methyltransferase YrrM